MNQEIGIIVIVFSISIIVLCYYMLYVYGRKNVKKINEEYESLSEGDLIKVSIPGYHHLANFESKSRCNKYFTATLYDYDLEIKERNKALTRLQFIGKV